MSVTIEISSDVYRLLQRRAAEVQSTPEQLLETTVRLHLGNTVHVEQRQTTAGPQAYIRGTRVAVRHIAAFLKAGRSVEEILERGLPQLSPAAVYEAIAYYFDHQEEIEAELAANGEDAVRTTLQQLLSPEEYAQITGQ